MSEHREFKDIRGSGAENAPAQPVDEFMASLEALQAEVATEKNLVWERVADGTLSEELLKRLCKEYYFLGKWYTTEFGSLVSNAPDVDALDLGSSEHFLHWLQNLADETGFAGDRNHVDMKIEWARMLGITDEELLSYRAMPESIGSVFTTLFYMRRSYEEGLAAFGWAGERFAASTGYATPLVLSQAGQKVTYVNLDNVQHDVNSTKKGPDGRPVFHSKLIGLAESAPVQGAEKVPAGTYEFYCSVHPGMRGNLVVR